MLGTDWTLGKKHRGVLYTFATAESFRWCLVH